jgi:hypothetical protein
LQAQRCLLLQGFCCLKSLYLAVCQKSPCCSLDAYSRPTFTVLLLLRLETPPEEIQLCGDISKGAKGVVDTQGQLVERVGVRSWFEASVQELGEATPCRVFIVLELGGTTLGRPLSNCEKPAIPVLPP